MKRTDNILTLRETEQLCRLYMEARLSLLEEIELQYLLGKLPYSTPLIDRTRTVMGLVLPASSTATPSLGRRFSRKTWLWASVAAACVAAVPFIPQLFKPEPPKVAAGIPSCTAYVHGRQVSGSEAEELLAEDMARTEAFLNAIDEINAAEQQQIERFINQVDPS